MKEITALYMAQAREFLRDRSTLFFVLLLPVAFGVFFGLVFSGTGGGSFTLQLGIVNEDTGTVGAEFVKNLQSPEAAKAFNVSTGTREKMLDDLNKANLQVVLVLPANMSASLAAGQPVSVDVFYDPSRQASAGIGLGMMRTMLNEQNLALARAPQLLRVREQTVQSNPPRMIDFYMAGMLGVALLWLGVFGVAQPVVTQRVAGVLRRFSVTAITRRTMLAGEVAWRVSVGILQAVIFLAVGYLGFQVGVKDWLPFAGAVLLGTLVFVSLGYVIAGLARSTESANGIGQLLNFPMMMLSGSIFSAEMLPGFFKPVVAIMPLTYLSDLFRQTMVGLTPMYPMALDFAVLGGWFIVLLALAAKLWRWE